MRTVVYVPSWNSGLATWMSQLDFNNVTHVNLSFAEVDEGGNVRYADGALPTFVERAHQYQAKVCVAIGGATTIENGGPFRTLLEDANRPAFVEKLITFVNANNLDCLDVDLEGQGVNQYYEAFVTELAARLKPQGKELSAAVAAWFGDKITLNALNAFDFINVMAYDLYFQRDTPMQWSSMDAATKEVDKWVERGVPRDRVVYGVPFYGMRWPVAGGPPETMGYGTLLRLDATVTTQDQLQLQDTIIYLNSRATIQAKAQLAQTYGGIMAWELSQDAKGQDSLLSAIRQAVP
jgi:GH18 family chitinase